MRKPKLENLILAILGLVSGSILTLVIGYLKPSITLMVKMLKRTYKAIPLLAFVILTVISSSCAILTIIFGDPLWLIIGTGVFLIKPVVYEVCTKGAGIRRLKQVFGRLKL